MILSPEKDPMGAAITAYYEKGQAERLRVFSSLFDEDEIPVAYLFREMEEMPALERCALSLAAGRILDVGAGAGCHALSLQNLGKEVMAIDISSLSVEVMRKRGVKNAACLDVMDESWQEKFDTILLLMNGTGIVGTMKGWEAFFRRMRTLLNEGGRVLLDSSDLRYVFEDEEGNFDFPETEGYYGEVDYQMQYRQVRGEAFPWLYVDFPTLETCAEAYGFSARLLREGEHYDYLAELRIANE